MNTQGVAVKITRLQESKVCQDLPTPTPLIINLENTHRQPLPARHSPPPYTGFSPPLHFIPVRKSAASAFLSTLPSLPLPRPSLPLSSSPLSDRVPWHCPLVFYGCVLLDQRGWREYFFNSTCDMVKSDKVNGHDERYLLSSTSDIASFINTHRK